MNKMIHNDLDVMKLYGKWMHLLLCLTEKSEKVTLQTG